MQTALEPNPTNPIDKQSQQEINLYSASKWEIFSKNFIAGFSRALGAIVIYFLIFGVISYFSYRFLLPQIQPFISSLQSTLQPGIKPSGGLGPNLNPNQVQDLLNQFNK